MNKIKENKFEILIFIVEAVCMILEIVASRVLSPFFGSSQVVWTSVIAIILLSSSIGNYIGGKIADGDNKEYNLKLILISAAILTFIIPIIQFSLIATIATLINDIRIGAIIATSALFLAPSIFLGMIPPIILKHKLQGLDDAGKTSGRITAISTIGGITGTILGGFFLVPNIGSVQILFVLALILTILSIFPAKAKNKMIVLFTTLLIIASIIGLMLSTHSNSSMEDKILSGVINTQISYDTEYGRALIQNREINGEAVRIMNIDSGYETIAYISEEKKNEPYSKYIMNYDLMFKSSNTINDVLMIGGAGYSYPRYYLTKYKDKKIDVVEIDAKVTEIAKKYFFLDDVIKELELENNNRLALINEDGRTFLNRNSKKYDAILNDAFSGNVPAKVLTTIEAVQNIKDSLVKDGLYLTNIIGSEEGKYSNFLKAEVNTIRQVFNNVYVFPIISESETFDTRDRSLRRNNIVIATDQNLDLENTIELDIKENEIIITDDYCPVDTLVVP